MTVLGRCALALTPLTVALAQFGGGFGGPPPPPRYHYGYYGGGGFGGGGVDTRQGNNQAVAQNGGSPCQPGSVAAFNCDFKAKPGAKLGNGMKPCLPGVNTGQNAKQNNLCAVPSPANRCELHFDPEAGAWMWYSELGVECCNCFQENQVCPMGSLPFYDCDFSGRPGPNACLPGVNTAQLATKNSMCQIPSPQNECLIKYDNQYQAFMFKSNKRGVTCCNCFQMMSMYPQQQNGRQYLLEVNATEHKEEASAKATEAAEAATEAKPEVPKRKSIRSHLRPSAASSGDAASMLQLPMGADDEFDEFEAADAAAPADLQEEGAEL